MENAPNILIGLSVVTIILSLFGAFGNDIWLASTQWVLIAAVLAIWAVFLKIKA